MEIYRPDRGNPSVELRMVTFTRSALVQSSMVPAKRSMKASLSLLYTWTFTVLGVVAICDMWWYGTSKGCFRFISLGFTFVVFVTSLIYSPEFTGNLGIWWNGTTQPEGNKQSEKLCNQNLSKQVRIVSQVPLWMWQLCKRGSGQILEPCRTSLKKIITSFQIPE